MYHNEPANLTSYGNKIKDTRNYLNIIVDYNFQHFVQRQNIKIYGKKIVQSGLKVRVSSLYCRIIRTNWYNITNVYVKVHFMITSHFLYFLLLLFICILRYYKSNLIVFHTRSYYSSSNTEQMF